MSEQLSHLMLERYVLGSATADERARIEASPEAMARVAELRRENDELMRNHPPAHVAAVVRARSNAAAPQRAPKLFLWFAPMLAMAAAVLFVVVPRGGDDIEVTRPKGVQPHLSLYRQIGASSEKLANGAGARAGDTVQVAYLAGEATYGAIVSVDGRGNVTVHAPTSGNGRLSQRNEVLLPRAYTLDDAPRFERFVFVAGKRPVDLEKLQKLLREKPELDADKLRQTFDTTVDVFTLQKEP